MEWFKHLSAKGAVPTHIELGNEFWVAMGQDPVVLRAGRTSQLPCRSRSGISMPSGLTFPRARRSPCRLPPLRSTASPPAAVPMIRRLRQWSEDLKPEPWFDAVTIHLYPRLDEVVGRGAAEEAITSQIACETCGADGAGGRGDGRRDPAMSHAASPAKRSGSRNGIPPGRKGRGKRIEPRRRLPP